MVSVRGAKDRCFKGRGAGQRHCSIVLLANSVIDVITEGLAGEDAEWWLRGVILNGGVCTVKHRTTTLRPNGDWQVRDVKLVVWWRSNWLECNELCKGVGIVEVGHHYCSAAHRMTERM